MQWPAPALCVTHPVATCRLPGIMPQPIPSYAYDASKAAVHMLTKKLSTELADRTAQGGHGITVNAIAPYVVCLPACLPACLPLSPRHSLLCVALSGFVPSSMSAQLLTYAGEKAIAATVPLNRLGSAADMGGATVFLASPAGAWVTGAILPVDGGTTAKPLAMSPELGE